MRIFFNYFLMLSVVISVNFVIDYFENITINNQKQILIKEAYTHYLSLTNMRHWNAKYDGVYVIPKNGMKPNPYLKDNHLKVDEYLTLIKINPAWMTRQLSEQLQTDSFKFKITSLNPKNPHNIANEFETRALNYFEKTKENEYYEFGKNDFNYMGVLITKPACLSCHADQGYKIGDIRGGISVSLDSTNYFEQLSHTKFVSLITKIVTFIFLIIIAILIHRQILNNIKLKEEVKKKTKEISQKNIYHRTLLESSLDPLVTISKDGKITDVNKATVKITGVNRNKLIGSDFSSYFTNSSDAKKGYEKVLKDGSVIDYPLQIENKNGEIKDVLYNASIYKDEDDNVAGVFAAARDVTEINKLRDKAQEADKLKSMSKLLENVAHHWRQPLSVISTSATGIMIKNEMDMLDSEELNEMAETIEDNAQNLSKTIEDFKLLFKDNSSEKNNSLKVVNIKDTVNSIIDQCGDYFRTDNLKVIKNLEDISVKLYENEFRQVLSNIFGNIKEHAKNSEVVMIDLYKDDENHFVLEIKDSGGGIDESLLENVFEAYFTTKHQVVGKGLGLYINYQLVTEILNGTISVKNEIYQYNVKEYKGLKVTIKI